ncbi:MAG: YlmC/YmxH family sporulation protein [Oscillospiraceae bacterium]|nr:YlmC/YmxH family sporulation protein [Oscillospiraceae bacterium]
MAELQGKELVNISDGTRYGCIGDLEIDTASGQIENVIVYGKPRALGFLGREADLVFPWSAIKRIGPDLILVDGH